MNIKKWGSVIDIKMTFQSITKYITESTDLTIPVEMMVFIILIWCVNAYNDSVYRNEQRLLLIESKLKNQGNSCCYHQQNNEFIGTRKRFRTEF